MRKACVTLFSVLVLACLGSGCMSVTMPETSAGLITQRPSINLRDASLDLSKLPPASRHSTDAREFVGELGLLARVNMETPDEAGINVTAVKIAATPRAGMGGPIILSTLSTVIVPLSLFSSRCVANVDVAYAVQDKQGNVTAERHLSEKIVGTYKGWSFVRFAFRGAVKGIVRSAVPRVAAEMLAKDLRTAPVQNPAKKEAPSASGPEPTPLRIIH